jgi:hypothetical protein
MQKFILIAALSASSRLLASSDFSVDCGDHYLKAHIEVNLPLSQVTFSGDSVDDLEFEPESETKVKFIPGAPDQLENFIYTFQLPKNNGQMILDHLTEESGLLTVYLKDLSFTLNCTTTVGE